MRPWRLPHAKLFQMSSAVCGFQNQSASIRVLKSPYLFLLSKLFFFQGLFQGGQVRYIWEDLGNVVKSGELLHPFIACWKSFLFWASFSPSALNSVHHYAGRKTLHDQLSNGPISGTGTWAKKPRGEEDEKEAVRQWFVGSSILISLRQLNQQHVAPWVYITPTLENLFSIKDIFLLYLTFPQTVCPLLLHCDMFKFKDLQILSPHTIDCNQCMVELAGGGSCHWHHHYNVFNLNGMHYNPMHFIRNTFCL